MARLDRVPCKIGFLLLVGFLLGSPSVETIRAQPTNTYFVVQEMAKVMDDSSFAPYKGRALSLYLDAPEPVISLLQQSLIDRGFRLFHPTRQDSMIHKVMIAPRFTLSFSAKQNKKGYRSLQGYLVATVMDHHDQILETYTLPVDVNDPIEVYKKQVEDEIWNLTRFSEPRNRFAKWNAILEPTIIISAVTTSIYLLFNVRSR